MVIPFRLTLFIDREIQYNSLYLNRQGIPGRVITIKEGASESKANTPVWRVQERVSVTASLIL